eukprot:CAMPEP_0176491498 /NCGR_PEP_ID=MMETSP0200_2-20121128/8467_1 /TAXON_ID=947934 /ORGANISM="Chaetoceros sp., Strain GSL56" /LENGTH=301 /DNA_ID=CAMNT_0017888937 /DNA_START=79 /DNA_END=981 /DNA_ORIENTATION=-
MTHQLGPPLPIQHLHVYEDDDHHLGHNNNSKSQSSMVLMSHQHIIEAHPFLMNVLCKVYMAHNCLQLSTETRFTSFQLFHKCLSHYIYYTPTIHSGSGNGSRTGSEKGKGSQQPLLPLKHREQISDLACAAIFLSCKLCNEHRRIRDVINIQKVFEMNSETSRHDNKINDYGKVEPPSLDEHYWKKKEEMVQAEQMLLRMINYDVTVCYPHRIMIVVWEELVSMKNIDNGNDVWKQVLHMGWKRLNDSLFHVDSLMCHSSSLALIVEAAGEEEVSWWEWLDVTVGQLNDSRDKLLYAAKIA